jgi:hypothetical protein
MSVSYSNISNAARLGNKLFILAATIALAKRNNDSYLFSPDDYSTELNLPQSSFSSNIKFDYQYQEPFFHYKEIPYQQNLNLHNSYFQSEKYFLDFSDEIRYLLTPKCAKYFPKFENTCAIHVRRGDYLTLPDHHPVLPMSYYQEAMNAVKAKKYMVFSDDPEWCANNFKGDQFTIMRGNRTYVDISLMSKCDVGGIIANSSYSYWGNWLNPNTNKIVIAPKNENWFGKDLKHHNLKDLIPESWIKI